MKVVVAVVSVVLSFNLFSNDPIGKFQITNLDNQEYAQEIFDSLISKSKWFAECFSRAHIWSKQMYDEHEINSYKVFIFYTKKFQREYNHKWWFHVAPVVNINDELHVFDKDFLDGPEPVSTWSGSLMEKLGKEYECKEIKSISEFFEETNHKENYCNIMYTSMYYKGTIDLKNLEDQNIFKDKFLNIDIQQSAKDMFWRWRHIYNRFSVKD